jgi:metal-sulfur cluster biosynthetic enzyme
MAEIAAIERALQEVIDPELGLNIVELGMVRQIDSDGEKTVVHMVLTTMTCPFWALFVDQIQTALEDIDGVGELDVRFDPRQPWTPAMMTDDARHELEIMGLLPTNTWLDQPAA